MLAGFRNNVDAQLNNARKKIVKDTLVLFKENYPHIPTAELHKRLKYETKRVCYFTPDSVVEDRFIRAGITFCIAMIPAQIGAVILYNLIPHANLALFVTPTISAISASLGLITTAQRTAMQRIKGGAKAVVGSYLDELKAGEEKQVLVEKKPESSNVAIFSQLNLQAQQIQEQAQQINELHAKFAQYVVLNVRNIPTPPTEITSANDNVIPVPEVRITCSP